MLAKWRGSILVARARWMQQRGTIHPMNLSSQSIKAVANAPMLLWVSLATWFCRLCSEAHMICQGGWSWSVSKFRHCSLGRVLMYLHKKLEHDVISGTISLALLQHHTRHLVAAVCKRCIYIPWDLDWHPCKGMQVLTILNYEEQSSFAHCMVRLERVRFFLNVL
jgi:hypothetical protein